MDRHNIASLYPSIAYLLIIIYSLCDTHVYIKFLLNDQACPGLNANLTTLTSTFFFFLKVSTYIAVMSPSGLCIPSSQWVTPWWHHLKLHSLYLSLSLSSYLFSSKTVIKFWYFINFHFCLCVPPGFVRARVFVCFPFTFVAPVPGKVPSIR